MRKPRPLAPKPASRDDIAFAAANRLKAKIAKRTGLKPEELQCPREASSMTPCIARDGQLAVAFGIGSSGLCVGCGKGVFHLLGEEDAKHK